MYPYFLLSALTHCSKVGLLATPSKLPLVSNGEFIIDFPNFIASKFPVLTNRCIGFQLDDSPNDFKTVSLKVSFSNSSKYF